MPASALESGFFRKSTTALAPPDASRIADAAVYEVQHGDTLSRIAARYSIRVSTIKNVNRLSSDAIRPGQKLTILPVDGVVYSAKEGDSLSEIARRFRVEPEEIARQNKLDAGQNLDGLELIIPGGKPLQPIRPTVVPVSSRFATAEVYGDSAPVAGQLLRPCSGVYTQYFSWRHRGLDIADRSAPTVFAASGGVVVEAKASGWNGGYGQTVVVDHGGGFLTRYAHFQKVFVAEGDRVVSGQALGKMGSTGRSTGTHLHFEVLETGVKKNPLAYF